MEFPRLSKERAQRTCDELRSHIAKKEEEIALFESGTVAYVDKPGGGRTTVNEYTLRRLYRERDSMLSMIEDLERQADA